MQTLRHTKNAVCAKGQQPAQGTQLDFPIYLEHPTFEKVSPSQTFSHRRGAASTRRLVVRASKNLIFGLKLFDLTLTRVPKIIVRTSILRRADRSADWVNLYADFKGWRRNIYLLPAVLFPHLEKA